jgi:hypothetical protein
MANFLGRTSGMKARLLRAALLASVAVMLTLPATASAWPRLFAGSKQGQCLAGRPVNRFLHSNHANVLRVILSPYWAAHRENLSCIQAAYAAHYKVYLSLQFSNRWTPRRVASYFAHVLPVYAPYLWAVGVGNEQDLPFIVLRYQRHRALTGTQYRAVWNAVEPVIARLAPHALRVYGEFTPWAFAAVEEGFALGRPRGVQAIAAHCYHTKVGGLLQVPALAAWAASQRLPLWCSEMGPAIPRRTTPHWAIPESQRSWKAAVARIVAESPNLRMLSYYNDPRL